MITRIGKKKQRIIKTAGTLYNTIIVEAIKRRLSDNTESTNIELFLLFCIVGGGDLI